MQEMNPDTVLEQAAPAADPEPQAVRPAEDTSIPSAPEAPATEAAAPQPEAPVEPAPVTVVDIRFRNNAKSYFFDPNGLTLAVGDHVIIDTARGDEFGICAAGNHAVRPRELVLPLRKVLRAATEHDERINAENQEKEKKAFDVCQQKILSHKLDMQLVSAECAFDGSKILFFFTAEGRVDFRELVKDLASAFRTRIELRQIGVRDKAKMVGGLGVCGRPFCCKEFLDDFQPVSIKMAKTQNLSLNPTKISGTCGRLMCCLKYEQEAYEDLIKTAPKAESFVDTPDGRGTVIEVNLLRQSVKVRMEDHPETIGSYKNTDIYIIRNGKARKNDPPIPKDLAPISSRPRPAQKKKEAFFEELPEVIYSVAVVVIAAVVSRFDNVIFYVETVKADGCVFVGNVGGYGLRQSVSVNGFGVEFDSADFSVFIFKTFVFFADVFFVFVVVTRSGFYAFSVELVIVKRVFKFVFGGYRFGIAYEVE